MLEASRKWLICLTSRLNLVICTSEGSEDFFEGNWVLWLLFSLGNSPPSVLSWLLTFVPARFANCHQVHSGLQFLEHVTIVVVREVCFHFVSAFCGRLWLCVWTIRRPDDLKVHVTDSTHLRC